jgi:hypothetical protein
MHRHLLPFRHILDSTVFILTGKVFKASPRRQGEQKTEASWTPYFSRLILFSFSFPYFSPFPGIFLVIWHRLALPRLTCRLKGKKGVNHHASPYRLKNYAYRHSVVR